MRERFREVFKATASISGTDGESFGPMQMKNGM